MLTKWTIIFQVILQAIVITVIRVKLGPPTQDTTGGATATLLALTRLTTTSSFSSMSHLMAITVAQVACLGTLSVTRLNTRLGLLSCCIAIHQTRETMTDQFFEDGPSESLPKLHYQCRGISGPSSDMLLQLHIRVIVIGYYHGTTI